MLVAFGVLVCKKVAVHVLALQVVAVVSADDTVRVDDRHHPYFVGFPHFVADQYV